MSVAHDDFAALYLRTKHVGGVVTGAGSIDVGAFIIKGTLAGVIVEFVRTNKTYYVLFSIAATSGATKNDANPNADQFVALVKQNVPASEKWSASRSRRR